MGGLPDPPLYDTRDVEGPYVGTPGSDVQPVSLDLGIHGPLSVRPVGDDALSEDHWYAESTWCDPAEVGDGDLLGDEGGIVRAGTEGISAPPTISDDLKGYVLSDEAMVS